MEFYLKVLHVRNVGPAKNKDQLAKRGCDCRFVKLSQSLNQLS